MLNSPSSGNRPGKEPPVPLRRKPKPPPPTPPKLMGVKLDELLNPSFVDLSEEISSKCEVTPQPKPRVHHFHSNPPTFIAELQRVLNSRHGRLSTGVSANATPTSSLIPKPTRERKVRGVQNKNELKDEDSPLRTSCVERINTDLPNLDGLQSEELSQRCVTDIRLLSRLGSWETLEPTAKLHTILTKYAENGSACFKPGEIKVNRILENKSTQSSTLDLSPNQMLLWLKTNRGNVQHLETRSPEMISFFDRISRAVTVEPKDVRQRHREIGLLCSVSLGKIYESKDGYAKWYKRSLFPAGFDSVKAIGKFSPDPKENRVVLGYTIVPCGATMKVKNKTRLEFNEYILNDLGRVAVKYAVGVEVSPSVLERDI